FVALEEAFPPGVEPIGENGAEWADEAWRAKRATIALGTLAAAQREAVVLFEIDGYSIEEIAAMQRASISAVKSRLTRGREKLRRFYEAHGGREPAGAKGHAGSEAPGVGIARGGASS